MNIPFWKMHGAGNDFILVDDRQKHFPAHDTNWLRQTMARRTGIGSDGILLIQPSEKANFRMRFFNPDGGEVDMCGNGARCIARLAHEIGVAPSGMSFETPAGLIRADVQGDQVLLRMTDPKDWRLNQNIVLGEESYTYHFVNTGVPHAVIEVKNLDRFDVQKFGAMVRYHQEFAPKGTNANFITITGTDSLSIRTYERGVEAETLACGTGIVAAGLVAARLGRVTPPVKITTAASYLLEVNCDNNLQNATLRGPAEHVFRGQLAYL